MILLYFYRKYIANFIQLIIIKKLNISYMFIFMLS